jgi:hypothetical protein
MAPELARVDLFSLGATMWRLLTGRRIHEASSPGEVLAMMASLPAPSIASVAPRLSPATVNVVDRALRFSRDERPPDASSMLADVRRAARYGYSRPEAPIALHHVDAPTAHALAPAPVVVARATSAAPVAAAPAPTSTSSSRPAVLVIVAAALVLAVGAGVLVAARSSSPSTKSAKKEPAKHAPKTASPKHVDDDDPPNVPAPTTATPTVVVPTTAPATSAASPEDPGPPMDEAHLRARAAKLGWKIGSIFKSEEVTPQTSYSFRRDDDSCNFTINVYETVAQAKTLADEMAVPERLVTHLGKQLVTMDCLKSDGHALFDALLDR